MFETLRQMISIPQIEADELRTLIENGAVSVVDANALGRYRKGHIPGAINVDPAGYRYDQLPSRPWTPMVFYCTGGLCGAARYAAKRALDMGETDVRLFAGGISEWQRRGFPVEEGETTRRPEET